jgi:hypothetical protein
MGATAGSCGVINTTGAGGCMPDGQACADGGNCCSRLCVTTNTGGHVCQVASGCRVEGDICYHDSDCCSVQNQQTGACVLDTTANTSVGRCRNPMGCDPEGNVCGGDPSADGGTVNARQDCCDCASPKFQCCKPDSNGVHRCYGTPAGGNCPTGYTGQAPCCIAAGQECKFSSECCNTAPCVPDNMGVLRCGASMCQASGGVCTTNGDCCAGLTCIFAGEMNTGTCGTPPPPTGTDGGAPTCASYGQGCATGADCCAGLNCLAPGGTGAACGAGQMGCTCVGTIL